MQSNLRHFLNAVVMVMALVATAVGQTPDSTLDARFLGSWAFALPDGNPAWLRLESDSGLRGSLLWSVGSARPVAEIEVTPGQLSFHRKIRWKPHGDSNNTKVISKPMVARLLGPELRLTVKQSSAGNDETEEVLSLTGKRMPAMPSRPDLDRIAFAAPIKLFNGSDLSGWRLSNSGKTNGWRAENGELVNETPKKDFGAYGDFGNLRTDAEFEDFHLSIEYNVPAGGNSGVYLRGMYEVQVVDRDSPMQGINGPGAVFGRIAPDKNAGNAGDQWNRYELTLVDRHVTVVLNGEKVIDNQPVIGCTGGGLSADDTLPGPIFLQGDHTSVRYRNIVLRRVVPRTR